MGVCTSSALQSHALQRPTVDVEVSCNATNRRETTQPVQHPPHPRERSSGDRTADSRATADSALSVEPEAPIMFNHVGDVFAPLAGSSSAIRNRSTESPRASTSRLQQPQRRNDDASDGDDRLSLPALLPSGGQSLEDPLHITFDQTGQPQSTGQAFLTPPAHVNQPRDMSLVSHPMDSGAPPSSRWTSSANSGQGPSCRWDLPAFYSGTQ